MNNPVHDMWIYPTGGEPDRITKGGSSLSQRITLKRRYHDDVDMDWNPVRGFRVVRSKP